MTNEKQDRFWNLTGIARYDAINEADELHGSDKRRIEACAVVQRKSHLHPWCRDAAGNRCVSCLRRNGYVPQHTRHHEVVGLERLQNFALEHKLLDMPVFGNLEKPRVGQRDRVPTLAETEAILARGSPAFRLIYSALRQCGARPGGLCRAMIADVDRVNRVIPLKEHKTARKTGQPRRIPIRRKLGELLDQAIGTRSEGPVFLSPSGRQWKVANLSRTYSRLRDIAGLPKDLVLYLARHKCGTKICRQKGIEHARRLLGHSNISTTQRYMHRDDRELADAQDLVE